jgi:hypothetical protein
MRLFPPPGGPSWLPSILQSIQRGLADVWDSPVKLQRLPTASLPAAADWKGGIVYDETTSAIKLSDGVTWAAVGGGGGGVSDGDKGDITVSGSGATWTIDAGVVTNAKLANVSTATFKGRTTAGTGAPEDLTATQATALLNVFTASANGLVPLSSFGPSTKLVLQDDATWVARVSSVGWTGGIVSIATATTTPAFTIAGTSGGIPYFSSGTTWATSAALAANALVIGGGAGVAPSTTTTGTGVVTALGVNVGSAGAFITFNGALGTPSSGTVTNLTGTASININGTVGATTPAAGTFTSLTWTGVTGLAGAIGAAIADYFSSTISLDASSTYEISCTAYFLKTTAGTVTWTWTFSSAPTMASSFYTATPITGFTTANVNGTVLAGMAHRQAATTLAHAASGSLTTAVYHVFRFDVTVRTNAATTIQLRATESAGTITPQAGSFMRASKVL